jgi:hypothetical protein
MAVDGGGLSVLRRLSRSVVSLSLGLNSVASNILSHSVEQSPSWKVDRFSVSQKNSQHFFFGTQGFVTAFTSARHVSLSWASSIRSIPPHPTSWRSILILSSHLCLALPIGFFSPSGFPYKTLYTPVLSPIHATYPTHLILLDFITGTILDEQYRSLSSSLCSLLYSPVASSLLGPNIFLNTIFSNTLCLRSFLNVSDQVSHPYITAGEIIVHWVNNLVKKRKYTFHL